MQKHNQRFKLLIFKINLQFVTSNQIPICRKLGLPLIKSIYLFFLTLEMQRGFKQTKQTYILLFR